MQIRINRNIFCHIVHFGGIVYIICVRRCKLSHPIVKPSLANKIKIRSDAIHARQIRYRVIAIQIARLQYPKTQTNIIFGTAQRIHAVKGIQPHRITRFGKHTKAGDIANGQSMIFSQKHRIFGGHVHKKRKSVTNSHPKIISDTHLNIIQKEVVVLVVKRTFIDWISRWRKDISWAMVIHLGDRILGRKHFFGNGGQRRKLYDFFSCTVFGRCDFFLFIGRSGLIHLRLRRQTEGCELQHKNPLEFFHDFPW